MEDIKDDPYLIGDGLLVPLKRKYKFKKRLGGGGFGKVYLVDHIHLEKEFALKILDYNHIYENLRRKDSPNIAGEIETIIKRFIHEAKVLNNIKHPNIVEINDLDDIKGKELIEIPFFIMNYIKGTNLKEKVEKDGSLDIQSAISISKDMLTALQIIHDNEIIHRDIKPENIIIEEDNGRAVLVDFGIAKDFTGAPHFTTQGIAMGTFLYMAPEQFAANGLLTNKTDIYSFGVVLFEMLTGEHPSNHQFATVKDVRQIKPGLPDGIDSIIKKAMEKEPGNRYNSANKFLKALTKIEKEYTRKKKWEKLKTKFLVYISLLTITVFIIIAACLIFKPGDSQYRELIDSANQYIQMGEYENARSDLNKAKAINNTGEVRWLLERAANKQKEKEKKIQERQQIDKMKEDYKKLQEVLKGTATRDKKIKQCRAFLETYKEIPTTGETTKMISGVQDSLTQLETDIQTGINKDNQYRQYINRVRSYIKAGNYTKAAEFLQQAKQIKDTPEIKQLAGQIETKKREEAKKLEYERINGTREYNAIKDRMNLRKYLEFKTQYPGSDHLPDLQKRLKAADQVLPPETYWDKPIKKNNKGYYEFRFGPKHNGHLMIYIPGKSFWIDKYEVSNLQFGNSLQGEYPAVVEYEQAVSYCQKYGFNLPTETEWEYAANGGKNIGYPWGNEKPDENGIYRANFDSFDDGFPNIAPVKSFEKFSSPFGVVNMAGNVAEWTQENHEKKLKGGTFVSDLNDLRIRSFTIDKSGESSGCRCIKKAKEE